MTDRFRNPNPVCTARKSLQPSRDSGSGRLGADAVSFWDHLWPPEITTSKDDIAAYLCVSE